MIEPLKLALIRHNYELDYTEGELFYENKKQRLCDTLEDRCREKWEKKVFGKTCIPPGTYDIVLRYSPSFGRNTIHIKDVPNFEYILMHYGATALNTEGCILCGERQKPGRLMNIGMTKKLVELLEKHGGKGTIIIV